LDGDFDIVSDIVIDSVRVTAFAALVDTVSDVVSNSVKVTPLPLDTASVSVTDSDSDFVGVLDIVSVVVIDSNRETDLGIVGFISSTDIDQV
jgi:hypothetical protein